MSAGFLRPWNSPSSLGCATAVRRFWFSLLSLAIISAGSASGQSQTLGNKSENVPSLPFPSAGQESIIQSRRSSGTPASKSSIGNLRIPAGTSVIVTDDPKKAEQLVPKAVILTPQAYQKLLDQIDWLSKEIGTAKPENPSSCKISGSIEMDLARLKILYEFMTDRPDTLINLGCGRAWATGASFDGELPWLQMGDEGYVVKIKNPGNHLGTLDVIVPLGTRRGIKGQEQGFDLDLPRPAISFIEKLKWSTAVDEIRLGGRALRLGTSNKRQSELEKTPIVPVEHLELSWKSPEPRQGPPVLAADSKIGVQIAQSQVLIEARINLQVLRGQTAGWRLMVPLPEKAELSAKADPRDEGRIERIERVGDPHCPTINVHLKDPSNDPLAISIQVRVPRSTRSIALGPFVVLDTLSQRGEIEIRAPDDVRLYYHQRSEVTRQEVSPEQRRDQVRAAFSYWNVAVRASPPSVPLLDIDIEPVKGFLETRTSHTIKLTENPERGGGRLLITTRIEATPVRTRVDHLNLSIPADLRLEAESSVRPVSLVEEFIRNGTQKTAMIKLAERQDRSFTVTLDGWYPLAAGQQKIALELPRITGWNIAAEVVMGEAASPKGDQRLLLDRGGQVFVLIPEGTDLLAGQFQKNLPSDFADAFGSFFSPLRLKSGTREYAMRFEKSLDRLDLAWREHRPDVKVNSTIDLTVSNRLVRFRQELELHLGQPTPERVFLRVPTKAQASFQVVAGGIVPEEGRQVGKGRIPIELTGPVNKDHKLILQYTMKIPEGGPRATSSLASALDTSQPIVRRITLPVVQIEEATQTDAKVRVWPDAGIQLGNAGNSWDERPCEIVEGRSSMPSLVIASRRGEPITLDLSQTSHTGASAVIDRTLIQVIMEPSGSQIWRTRYWLGQVGLRRLVIRFPYLVSLSEMEARLGDKRVPLNPTVENASSAAGLRRVQFEVEPELYPAGALLDLRFKMRPDSTLSRGVLAIKLEPPTVEDSLTVGRARWQMLLPADYLDIHIGGGAIAEWNWEWRKWLPGPSPNLSQRDLERWITRSNIPEADEEAGGRLVCWQSSLASLPIVLVSQRLWLFSCSLGFVLFCTGLMLSLRRPVWFWSLALLAPSGMGVVSVYWPSTLPALVYGCEPGILIVFTIGTFYGLFQLRHRRQINELPGFSRAPRAPSLAKSDGVNGQRPPSTIDSMPKRGSSFAAESRSG